MKNKPEAILLYRNEAEKTKLEASAETMADILDGLAKSWQSLGLKKQLSLEELAGLRYSTSLKRAEEIVKEAIYAENDFFRLAPITKSAALGMIELPPGFSQFRQWIQHWMAFQVQIEAGTYKKVPLEHFELTAEGVTTKPSLESWISRLTERFANSTEAKVYALTQQIKASLEEIHKINPRAQLLPQSNDLLETRPVFSANDRNQVIYNAGAIRAQEQIEEEELEAAE